MVSSAFPRSGEYVRVISILAFIGTVIVLTNYWMSWWPAIYNPINCWMIIKSRTKNEKSYLSESMVGKKKLSPFVMLDWNPAFFHSGILGRFCQQGCYLFVVMHKILRMVWFEEIRNAGYERGRKQTWKKEFSEEQIMEEVWRFSRG